MQRGGPVGSGRHGAAGVTAAARRSGVGQPSPELARARELLGDDRWHDYELIVHELVKVIPPGRAVREAEKLRVAQARKRARYAGRSVPDRVVLSRRTPRELDQIRYTGARSIVRKMLNGSDFDIDPPIRQPRRIRWTTARRSTKQANNNG